MPKPINDQRYLASFNKDLSVNIRASNEDTATAYLYFPELCTQLTFADASIIPPALAEVAIQLKQKERPQQLSTDEAALNLWLSRSRLFSEILVDQLNNPNQQVSGNPHDFTVVYDARLPNCFFIQHPNTAPESFAIVKLAASSLTPHFLKEVLPNVLQSMANIEDCTITRDMLRRRVHPTTDASEHAVVG